MTDRKPNRKLRFGVATVAGAIMAAAALAGTAQAQAVDFKGKTVEFTIPFGTGGGSDVWSRFFAPLIAANLPGKPTIVVKNVAGGSSITGTNQFMARAKPDGLHILGTSATTQFPFLLDDPRVRYDYKNLIPILVSPTGGVVYVNPSLGAKSARDLAKIKSTEMKYGSQGPTSLDLVPLLSFEIMGLNVKPVFGMTGRGPSRLAFERGEALIDYQTTSAYIRNVVPLVKQGKAVPIYTWGVIDANGEFARDPTFPDLPHFAAAYEMAYGKKPSGDAFDAFKAFVTAGFAAQKPLFLPKGTPKPIVDAYVVAVEKAVKTPGFRQKAGDVLGDYEQDTGAKADKTLNVALGINPKAKAWVKKWLTEKYSVKLGK